MKKKKAVQQSISFHVPNPALYADKRPPELLLFVAMTQLRDCAEQLILTSFDLQKAQSQLGSAGARRRRSSKGHE
jgi:hypothetical protein